MKIIFAGTPEFAKMHLEALVNAGYPIDLVLSQPDRPFGRGRQLTPSPVKAFALEANIPVLTPTRLKKPETIEALEAIQPDLMIVVAYGLLLPTLVLKIPTYGCINVHASLLPRWRGASPIQQALLNGDQQTGITVMKMTEGLDEGPILYQSILPILEEDTSSTLHDRLAKAGSRDLLMVLNHWPTHFENAMPQSTHGITYAPKIQKQEAQIHWKNDDLSIMHQIQAFNPWPVAESTLNGRPIRFFRAYAKAIEHKQAPGTLLSVNKEGILIACGKGALLATQLQLPNKKVMTVQEILNGDQQKFLPGMCFL